MLGSYSDQSSFGVFLGNDSQSFSSFIFISEFSFFVGLTLLGGLMIAVPIREEFSPGKSFWSLWHVSLDFLAAMTVREGSHKDAGCYISSSLVVIYPHSQCQFQGLDQHS